MPVTGRPLPGSAPLAAGRGGHLCVAAARHPGEAFVEVPEKADIQELARRWAWLVNWLVRAASAAPQADPAALPGALDRVVVTGAAFPASRCDAFAAGGGVRGGRPAPSPRG